MRGIDFLMGRKKLQLKALQMQKRRSVIRHRASYFERLGEPAGEDEESQDPEFRESDQTEEEGSESGNTMTEAGEKEQCAR